MQYVLAVNMSNHNFRKEVKECDFFNLFFKVKMLFKECV